VKKKIFSIWSVLLILIVSIAVVVPGCNGTTGTIEVKATLCGDPWTGDVEYTLTLPGATAPTIIDGTSVNATHSGVECGNWTCEYVSGGPDAYLVDITPPSPQEVTSGGTITFTLNFEKNQDAGIEWLTWTIDGVPIEEYQEAYYEPGYAWYAEVSPCQIIDAHFTQWVNGCEGRVVSVNETSWLKITQIGEPAPATVFVIDDWCALNKTPEPIEKVSQVPSFYGDPVEKGAFIVLTPEEPVDLDVVTLWDLEKCLNYTKSINWLGISLGVPEPGHDCVLFELVVPGLGDYTFTLVASAEVELVDDEDVDVGNNDAESLPLILTVSVP